MASYQTQSRVSIIGTVPATIVGTVPVQAFGGTITATILGTVVTVQPFLGTIGIVGTIATILSPITAVTTPIKRGTVSIQRVATVPTTVATLLDPNSARAQFYIRLLDTGTVLLGFAGSVSAATFAVMLLDFEMYSDDIYTGVVTGIALGTSVRVVVNEL